jgi:hypothetical protein
MAKKDQKCTLGKSLALLIFQRLGIGAMSKELTIFPGTRTNTFHNIVDHAGLREPPLQLRIDSTSCSRTKTQLQLLSMPKSLSTVVLVEAVREVTQEVFTNTLSQMVSQILLASNMLQKTQRVASDVMPRRDARIAHGLHAQLVRLAKTNAGLSITRATTFPTTTLCLALTR